jgi:hypothetical protein
MEPTEDNLFLPDCWCWDVVFEQTSYVPSDTTQKFITLGSLKLGFQSSIETISSENRKHNPVNFPLLTREPELQADMLVLSRVSTTAPRFSDSALPLHALYQMRRNQLKMIVRL